jgi:cell division protease FtsH
MVINYGMSDIGPWSLLDPSAQSGDVVMRMMARNSMSENLQQRIDDAVKKIAEEAYKVALRHIRDNRWVLRCSVVDRQSAAVCRALYIC